jgi:hypothetical protein
MLLCLPSVRRSAWARVAMLATFAPAAASADVAFDNFGPGNTFAGNGWLIQGPQAGPWSHAFPFTSAASGEISTLVVALHHLQGQNGYTFELRADTGGVPGASLGPLGEVAGFLEGEEPVQFSALPGVTVAAGTNYWLYCRGVDTAFGTWRTSPNAGGTRAYSLDGGTTWTVESVGATGAISAFRIETGGSCYADCDRNQALNVDDFICFINEFAQAQSLPPSLQFAHYANCSGTTTEPILTVDDFICFINEFAQGCS